MKGGYRTIDKFIGGQIRQRRTTLGLSQRDLAESLGVAQQMLAKYELGKTAVSASVLFDIAGSLSTSIDYFFAGFGAHGAVQGTGHEPMLLNLMRSFSEIDSEQHRRAISDLIRALAG